MRRSLSFVVITVFASLVAGCGNEKKSSGSSCPAPVGTEFDADGDLLTNAEEARLGTDPEDGDSDGDGFGDYVEARAGTDPLAEASSPSGAVARVREIETAADLIGGRGAIGAVGDWLLENDRIRAIVQRVDAEQMQVGTYGGNLVDADVVRPVDEEGNDTLGMIIPLFSFQQTVRPTRAVVVNDGSDGGAAVLRVCGKDDTFEYLDLVTTFGLFGIGSDYEQNPDFDMHVSTEYTLAPGSDRVEVVTTLENHGKKIGTTIGDVIESGSSAEIFNTNNQGFGQVGFSDILNPTPPSQFMGFLSPGSSWGVVPDSDPNVSVTVSGVTVTVPGFTSALDGVTSNPEEPGPGIYEIGKGKRISWRRTVVIGDGSRGLADVTASYYEKRAVAPVTAAGSVSDSGGPLAGVRVALLSKSADEALDRVPLSATVSGSDGSYAFTVPPGEYYVVADAPGRLFPSYSGGTPASVTTRRFQNVLPAAAVVHASGTDLPDILFDAPSIVSLDVVRASDLSAVPARLSVVGTDPSPDDAIFRDPKERTSTAVPAHALAGSGSHDFALEPGVAWEIYASHGIEWSRDSVSVTLAAGVTSSAQMVIGPVVDSTGWISADFHVHTVNSPDSSVPLETRVINAVTDGLDVIVATDHDYITDLAPVVAELGLQSSVAAVTGEEITTWAMGHFNLWPLTADPTRLADGGAYKWAGGEGAESHRTAQQIFEDMDAAHPGTQVRQVNHPRAFALQAYYTAIELDMLTLASKRDLDELRVPPIEGATEDDTLLFHAGFDAQEVLNGTGQDPLLTNNYLNDLFTLLSHGLTLAGTGNSDTHKVFSGQLGYPRNFVALANDAPGSLGGQLEPFAVAMKEGRSFFSTGPFVRVTATGATTGGPGDLIAPAGGNVTLDIDLEMPDWIEVDTVRIYVNTPGTAAPSDENGLDAAPAAAHVLPVVLTTTSAGFGLSKNVANDLTQVVSVGGLTTDAWIVVTVSAESTATSLFPVVPNGTSASTGEKPFALVNAIYVDVDGDSTYDPPGATAPTALAKTPSDGAGARPAIRRFRTDEVDANRDAIREQWRRLTEGACRGDAVETHE